MFRIKRLFIYLVLTFFTVVFLYPFLWMVSASFRPESEIGGFGFIPSKIQISNYIEVFRHIPLIRAFLNSLLVSGVVTGGVLFFGSMMGYALSRLRFKGREVLFMVILFTMMIPIQMTLIPTYILMVRFHWVNTYWALIIPYLINGLGILLFRQYFLTIPRTSSMLPGWMGAAIFAFFSGYSGLFQSPP